MVVMRKALSCLALSAALVIAVEAYASPIQITVDTSSVVAVDASLIFDLIDGGDGPTPSSVKIYDFSTDGTLVGLPQIDGDVTGTLPGTFSNPLILADGAFFNDYLRSITLGTFITFIFDPSEVAAVDTPDGFSFLLLDPSGNSVIPTSDETGALLLYSIGNPDPLQVFSSAVTVGPNAVPEPASYAIVIAALLAFGVAHRLRQSRPQQKMRG